MEKKKVIISGIENPNGYEVDNRVYDRVGISPTQRAKKPLIKVIKKWKKKN